MIDIGDEIRDKRNAYVLKSLAELFLQHHCIPFEKEQDKGVERLGGVRIRLGKICHTRHSLQDDQ